jgi:hypothetical protein
MLRLGLFMTRCEYASKNAVLARTTGGWTHESAVGISTISPRKPKATVRRISCSLSVFLGAETDFKK